MASTGSCPFLNVLSILRPAGKRARTNGGFCCNKIKDMYVCQHLSTNDK